MEQDNRKSYNKIVEQWDKHRKKQGDRFVHCRIYLYTIA